MPHPSHSRRPLALTICLLLLAGLTSCNTRGTETPATAIPATIPSATYLPATDLPAPTAVPGQPATWAPILPPTSFFDDANAIGDDFLHEGYEEWASREVFLFSIRDFGLKVVICSVSAKNTSNLNVRDQTYPQADGATRFKPLCVYIQLTRVGDSPEGSINSFQSGMPGGTGLLLIPGGELSREAIYVARIKQPVSGASTAYFTGEVVTDEVIGQNFNNEELMVPHLNYPGLWSVSPR